MISDPAQVTHLVTVAQKEMDIVMKEKARAAMEETIKDVMVFTTKNKTNDDFEHQLLKQRRICNPEARELLNMYLMYRGQDEAPNTFLCCYRCKGCCHTMDMCKNTRTTVMDFVKQKKPRCPSCGGDGHDETTCGIVLNKDCPKWQDKQAKSQTPSETPN